MIETSLLVIYLFDARLLLVLLAIIAVVAVASYLLVRRRENLWRTFARRHMLTFRKGTAADRDRVSGIMQNRRVELAISQNSSDTGVLGAEEVVMTVELLGRVPEGLQVLPDDLGGVSDQMSEGETIATGDEAFDQHAVIRANNSAEAKAFLTPPRRAALLELLSADPNSRAGLHQGSIFLEWREMVTQLTDLDARLHELLATAQRLDGER